MAESPGSRPLHPRKAPPPGARLTIVEKAHYQPEREAPFSLSCGYSRRLFTDEQPYQRRMEIGEEWRKLDTGWIQKAGLLHLQNLATPAVNLQRPDETFEAIEIAWEAALDRPWLLYPGESMRGVPARLDGLMVRCREGRTKLQVTIFPEAPYDE